jgi:hypothetical protein
MSHGSPGAGQMRVLFPGHVLGLTSGLGDVEPTGQAAARDFTIGMGMRLAGHRGAGNGQQPAGRDNPVPSGGT